MRFTPNTLQGRFLAGLLTIMLLLGLCFAFALNIHLSQLLKGEAREKATLILSQAEAIQSYVRKILRPTMYEIVRDDEFIIEAMSSSFITRNILSDLNDSKASFLYRRVAQNSRNPDFEANAMERAFIKQFHYNPQLKRIESSFTQNGEEHFVVARAVYFTAECMHCHGDPADAPLPMVAKYGPERGFQRQVGDLAGIDMVALPMRDVAGMVRESATLFGVLFAGSVLLMFLGIHGFFYHLVVHNLKRVGNIMQRNFAGEADKALLDKVHSGEEIDDIVHSFEELAGHLSMVRQQLSDYAKNLEHMVASRTIALQTEAAERGADVALFVNLLERLNRSQAEEEMLSASLALIVKRFKASRAVFISSSNANGYIAWPPTEILRHASIPDCGPTPDQGSDQGSGPHSGRSDPDDKNGNAFDRERDNGESATCLPAEIYESLPEIMCGDAPSLLPRAWYIPVQTPGSNHGLLCLLWDEDNVLGSDSQWMIAQALGRQLGIALDSIAAMNKLLRQNNLLDSIFEGISDPLILVDRNGHSILANASAAWLAASLAGPLSEVGEKSEKNTALKNLLGLLELDFSNTKTCFQSKKVLFEDGRSFMLNLYPIEDNGEKPGMGQARSKTVSESNHPDQAYQPDNKAQQDQRCIIHLRETTEERLMMDRMLQNEKLAAVGQLAAGLAHEINNPLGVIRCYTELLGSALNSGNGDADGEQAGKDIETILRHIDQAQKVVKDLLDFSRPKPASTDALSLCDINGIIGSLSKILQSKAKLEGHELYLDLDPSLPMVQAIPRALEQILINLILNALDSVPKGRGEVHIATRMHVVPEREGNGNNEAAHAHIHSHVNTHANTRQEVLIQVSDNGKGINPAHLAHIFEPFFTTKAPGAGTGLGLSVVFGLVSDMGARIEAMNGGDAYSGPHNGGNCERGEKGKCGAIFNIYLPLASMPEQN